MYRDTIERSARTLIISLRNINNYVYNSCLYEFEDVIDRIDEIDLLNLPNANHVQKLKRKVLQQAVVHLSPQFANLNPSGNKAIALEKEYDILFVIIDFPCNLLWLNLIKEWRKKCKICVCYVIEIWQEEIKLLKNNLKFLENFDYIFLGHSQIVDSLEKLIDRPCEYLPPAIDAIKFAPKSLDSHRSIDLCSMGRRSHITHKALLNLAEKQDFFYHYDPPRSADNLTFNHQHHRTFNANILKHSRYFIANRAKINVEALVKNQAEIGYRFFEGAASGTVMLGTAPDNRAFKKYFDWENVVIPMQFDEPNIAAIIAELDRQPEYLATVRKNNIVNTLLRHDWSYRWQQILDRIGLLPNDKLFQRRTKLKELAASIGRKKNCSNFRE